MVSSLCGVLKPRQNPFMTPPPSFLLEEKPDLSLFSLHLLKSIFFRHKSGFGGTGITENIDAHLELFFAKPPLDRKLCTSTHHSHINPRLPGTGGLITRTPKISLYYSSSNQSEDTHKLTIY